MPAPRAALGAARWGRARAPRGAPAGHGRPPKRTLPPERAGPHGGYLVDSTSSHMLVSKIEPCMSKYKQELVSLVS